MDAARGNRSLGTWLAFVKFEHTLFALPFAYAGMTLAAGGWPGAATFAWITLAMVGARTAAMAVNRVADATIDGRSTASPTPRSTRAIRGRPTARSPQAASRGATACS